MHLEAMLTVTLFLLFTAQCATEWTVGGDATFAASVNVAIVVKI